MKNIKQGLFEGQNAIPTVDTERWADAKNQHFRNMAMLYIKLKVIKHTIPC